MNMKITVTLTGQPHLHPGKGDGAAYPGGHHEASGRKEGYQE